MFHVSLWEDEVGAANLTNQTGVPDNDSLVHVQTFRDYYAYDDGTAEKAYALEGQGGELVVRFDIQQPDTLDGVWMHFTPFFDDAVGETFTLKVRGEDPDVPGQPGEALQAQFVVHEPNYFTGSHDGFVYYPFNAPIAVDGPVFVGFVQQGEERIHVGLDKNTDTNADHLWYKFPDLALAAVGHPRVVDDSSGVACGKGGCHRRRWSSRWSAGRPFTCTPTLGETK